MFHQVDWSGHILCRFHFIINYVPKDQLANKHFLIIYINQSTRQYDLCIFSCFRNIIVISVTTVKNTCKQTIRYNKIHWHYIISIILKLINVVYSCLNVQNQYTLFIDALNIYRGKKNHFAFHFGILKTRQKVSQHIHGFKKKVLNMFSFGQIAL